MNVNCGDSSTSSANAFHHVRWDALQETRRIMAMVPEDPGMDYYREQASDALMTLMGALFALGLLCRTHDLVVLLNNARALDALEMALTAKDPASPDLRKLRLWLDRFRALGDAAERHPPSCRVDIEKVKHNLGGMPSRIVAFSTT